MLASDSEISTDEKITFSKGMMMWMLLHKREFFWMRAIFQIIAFSFLIVTLLMLINFDTDETKYWHGSLVMLVGMHCINMVAFSLDLLALSTSKIEILRYKLALDLISTILIIIVQVKLFHFDDEGTVSLVDETNPLLLIRLWLIMEVTLFYEDHKHKK